MSSDKGAEIREIAGQERLLVTIPPPPRSITPARRVRFLLLNLNNQSPSFMSTAVDAAPLQDPRPVYCLCRGPDEEDRPMIACDGECEDWFVPNSVPFRCHELEG
jgi:hypothetical protein